MIIKILYPEDTKSYDNFFPVYGGKEEIIQKAAEYLNFEDIKELLSFLEPLEIEKFKNREYYLQVGTYGFESWNVNNYRNNSAGKEI